MVRRSTLVYDLLRGERRDDGFSPKEIIEAVSQAHNIVPGKGLKKQVSVALRRGIDFGILKRQNNRYRFDLGFGRKSQPAEAPTFKKKKKARVAKKPRAGNSKPRPRSSKPRSGKSKPRRKRNPPAKKQPQDDRVIPRPRIPHPPPTWTQKKRILREEPMPKYIRHPSNFHRL